MNATRIQSTAVLLGLCAVIIALPVQGAPSPAASKAAKRDVDAMYEALRDGRLNDFASFTYPRLLELMGGKQKMVATMEQGQADLAKRGVRWVSGKASAPLEIAEAGKDLQALLSFKQVLAVDGGELHVSGTLLGISSDAGKTWTFLDTTNMTTEKIRQVVPNLSPRIKIPKKTDPVFIRK